MKTKSKQERNGVTAKRVTVKGKRMVMLEEQEFERLLQKADVWEPAKPEPNANGNYPAEETMAVHQALDILRTRRKLGLSQAELARRAGIRPETLNRIEQARNAPSVPTIVKIDRALKAAEEESEGA